MAPTTVEAEFTVVYVIGAMTIRTATSQPGLGGEWAPVTGVAGHAEMGALQHEVGLPIVVELPLHPVHWVVAQRAVVRQAILVWIAVAVTFDALC